MSITTATPGRRMLALLGALALTGVGVLAGATNAQAAGNIDPGAARSIIIHKHEHQTTTSVTASPNGSVTIPSAPLENVVFTAYELRKDGAVVNLTDPAAWDGLAGLSVNAGCTAIGGGTGYTIGSVVGTGTTNGSGLATITPSSIGAFVVCETSAPAAVTDTAAPFIVTVPFPYQHTWLYNVHVYPKNGTSAVTKTISPQTPNGITLGSTIQFPVTVRIPSMAAGHDFTSFDVADTLDTRLTPSPAAAGVGQGVLSVTVNGTAVNPSYYQVNVSGQTVTVAFNTALPAVQTLLKGAAGQNAVVTFQGTVTTIGNGEITNQATGYVNDPGHTKGITSNQVKSNWGDIKILKTDAATPAVPLSGAEFQVYAAETPYPATADECTNAVATGDPLSLGGQSTFTSVNGLVAIPGLFVSDSQNAPLNNAFRCYVVVETKAPAGFVTPVAPTNAWGIDVTIGQTTDQDQTVVNTQQIVPALPLTGAGGTMLLTVVGLVLIGSGAGVVLVARHRRQHAGV
jgi:fimbrial isopeptide formation D2 family protein/LPXTG-motif cell wall-anchored protein